MVIHINKNILLVEPEFPIPPKSKNHKNFLPIGLLKIGNWLKQNGHYVILVRGNLSKEDISYKFRNNYQKLSNKNIVPDKTYITSLFTYWSDTFWESVNHYRTLYKSYIKQPEIKVGGVYVSLFYGKQDFMEKCRKYKINPHVGIMRKAEKIGPDYTLLDNSNIDYQILHTSRGCTRKCKFCGTHIIESGYDKNTYRIANYYRVDKHDFIAKKSILNEIKLFYPKQYKLIFYDNNLLFNHPYIENILNEIIEFNQEIRKKNRKNKNKKSVLICESQSGFDGRVLLRKPTIALLLKMANFRNIRIAWDNSPKDKTKIKKQLDILHKAGFPYKEMFVFVLYNWKYGFYDLEEKRLACWDWKVQIADCRFRPLNREHEKYRPKVNQEGLDEYYIHPKWSDIEVKQYRRNIRRQNICVRQSRDFYSASMEQKRVPRKNYNSYYHGKIPLYDKWYPGEIHELEDDIYAKKYKIKGVQRRII